MRPFPRSSPCASCANNPFDAVVDAERNELSRPRRRPSDAMGSGGAAVSAVAVTWLSRVYRAREQRVVIVIVSFLFVSGSSRESA